MITKQLKSLLMIPSPNALRPRSPVPASEAAGRDCAPADRVGAARAEPHAPPREGEAPAPGPAGEPAPSRTPAVPSFLRASLDGPGSAASDGPTSDAAAMSAVPEGMRRFTLRGTAGISDAPRGPALPFKAGDESTSTAAPTPPRPAPRSADPASLVPPGMRGFTALRGTQPTSSAASTAPVLPFGPPAPPAPAKPAAASAEVPEGMRGFTSSTGTQPASGAPPAAVLPFSSSARRQASDAPASPPAAALSLEQYASLCAELAASPGDAEALFARYGLGQPEARLAVDSAWRDRLARDPSAHRRWQELYWQHRSRSSPARRDPNEPR
ncbi:hypothetical protein [Sorangium cellulosum]|nr:hypothetical protein [Sorangium cellulosum]